MTNDYRPIPCDLHSVLELLALRRTRGVAHASTPGGGTREVEGTIVDLAARAGVEYLDMVDARGRVRALRLDRLHAVTAPGGELLWSRTGGDAG